jgi:hypothetical protein
MAARKHVTLVADADTSIPLTGRGNVLVQNHSTAANDLLYVSTTSGVAATVGGDDMICIGTGGFRIFGISDKDGTIDLHVISHGAIRVSAEVYERVEAD